MSLVYADRVKETTATTGTGTITLAGAVSGFRTFTSALSTGSVVTYCIEDGTAWEVGRGTFTTSGTTLSRGLIASSTGSALNLSGSATVFLTHAARSMSLPGIDVREYGSLDITGTSDCAAVLQLALNDVDVNRGGRIFIPQGKYRIASGLTIPYQGTEIVGEGMPGRSAAVASGSSRIISDDGVTAFTYNSAGSSHFTLGVAFRRLHIRAATSSTTGNGILVRNVESSIFEDVTCSDYIGGYGLRIDGSSGNAQYSELRNFSAGDCLTGVHLTGTGVNGTRIFGGYFEGQSTTPRSSSVGIHIASGDTTRIFGAVIQGYATGIHVASSAVGHEIHGLRTEYCNIGLRVGASASAVSLFGHSHANALLGGGGSNIGIQVDSGAADTLLIPTAISGVSTAISDAGTNTKVINVSGGLDTYAASGVTLTTSSNYVTSDVTMTTAGTYYDGPTLTLAAGTWLLIGAINFLGSTTGVRRFDAKLWDGTTITSYGESQIDGTGAAGLVSVPLSGLVSPSGSTTYKISGTSTANNDTLKGAAGNKVSYLLAIKVG